MTTLTTMSHAVSNTNYTKNRVRCWEFTFNNYSESDILELVNKFNYIDHTTTNSCKYFFAKEVGESGTPHLQGFCQFKLKMSLAQLRTLFGDGLSWRNVKNKVAIEKYCQKGNGERYTNIARLQKRRTPSSRSYEELYDWQKSIVDEVSRVPDDRHILWVYDACGGRGKSELARHLIDKHSALVVGGKQTDIFQGVRTCLEQQAVDIVIVELYRAVSKPSYASMEALKNGYFFSSKYESAMCRFPAPHVVVLANSLPDWSELTTDRWRILDLSDPEFTRRTMEEYLIWIADKNREVQGEMDRYVNSY